MARTDNILLWPRTFLRICLCVFVDAEWSVTDGRAPESPATIRDSGTAPMRDLLIGIHEPRFRLVVSAGVQVSLIVWIRRRLCLFMVRAGSRASMGILLRWFDGFEAAVQQNVVYDFQPA